MPPLGRDRVGWAGAALLALLAAARAGATEVHLPAGTRQVDLDRHAEFLLDPSRAMDLAEVRAGRSRAGFRPLGGSRSLGFTSAALWLRVDLVSDADAPRRLV